LTTALRARSLASQSLAAEGASGAPAIGKERLVKRFISLLVTLVLLLAASSTAALGNDAGDADWLAYGASRHGLTDSEFRDAVARQEAGDDLVLEVRQHAANYGGVYWDWKADPPGFVVLYTAAAPTDSFDASVRLVHVERSYAELARVLGELASAAKAGDPSETGFVSVGIDEASNVVNLTVTAADAPMAKVAAEFEDAVSIVVADHPTPAACNNRNDCIPFRGGIKITSNQYDCSYGMNGRQNNGYLVMVTAGHCDWNVNQTWRHLHAQAPASQTVGNSTLNGLHNGKDLDALRVRAYGAQVQNPLNRVYSTDANKSMAVTGAVSNANIFSGMTIRRVGFNTQKNGEVTGGKMFYSFWWEGWWRFAWGFPSTATSVGGDSGGTVFRTGVSTNALLGFNSVQEGIFASQEDAKIVLHLSHFCITNAC
jgi:hypothetical protein